MRILLLFCLLAGCSSAPPPASNQNRSSGAEEPPPAARAWSLDGRWFFLEVDDDGVEVALEVDGASAHLVTGDGERLPIRLSRGDDGFYELEVRELGEGARIQLAPQGDGVAIAIATGEDEARLARRAEPLAAELQGTWHLADPEDPRVVPDIVVEARGERVRYVERDRVSEGRIWSLAPAGPSLDVVVSLEGAREMRWARFFRVAPDVYVVTAGGDDNYLVAHRPGRRPRWLVTPADFARE